MENLLKNVENLTNAMENDAGAGVNKATKRGKNLV